MDQFNTQFKVFEDGSEYLGMAEVTLPTLTWLTQNLSGAGISGNIEAVAPGHVDVMSLTMNFRTTTEASIKLSEPRRHNIDLRIDQLHEDPVSGELKHVQEKHVLVVIPKSHAYGKAAPVSPTDGSGEYSVRYWKVTLGGKVVQEIDPFNNICKINGVDYLADERKNLS